MLKICVEISPGLITAREAVLGQMKSPLHEEEKASHCGQTRPGIPG